MEFIDDEENVLKAKAMMILLRNQMIEGLDPDYIAELKDPHTDYDERTIHEMFDYLFEEYGELGITERRETMETFRSGPDWEQGVDALYARYQECMETMEDTDTPITENTMVQQLVDHVAQSDIVPRARQKWDKHIKANRGDHNWKFAKKWFREAIKEQRRAEQDVSADGAVMSAQLRQNQKDELKRQILTDMLPKLDKIVEAAAGNKSDREMIAAMTADNLTVTSKLDAVLAENQRVLAEKPTLQDETGCH